MPKSYAKLSISSSLLPSISWHSGGALSISLFWTSGNNCSLIVLSWCGMADVLLSNDLQNLHKFLANMHHLQNSNELPLYCLLNLRTKKNILDMLTFFWKICYWSEVLTPFLWNRIMYKRIYLAFTKVQTELTSLISILQIGMHIVKKVGSLFWRFSFKNTC